MYEALVGVDHAAKRSALPLAVGRFGEQVVILCKQHSLKLCCAIQHRRITKFACSVLMGRKHVHRA